MAMKQETNLQNGVSSETVNGHNGLNGLDPKLNPMDRACRSLKVIQIGAGVTGIEIAYCLKGLEGIELTIYDKNPDLGGTWLENRYPGCACDVPAHSYSYNWAPNPYWSSWIVGSEEIHAYLTDVAKQHDLRKYMVFNHKVVSADWQEDEGKWSLEIVHEQEGHVSTINVKCDVLISGTGALNNWSWPKIEGLKTFSGPVMHTANWDPTYDFKDKRVAVLGNGASAIQVVPELRKVAKQVDVFMRSTTWLLPTPWLDEGITREHIYSEEETKRFATDPEYLLQYRKKIDERVNSGWPMFYKNSPESQAMRAAVMEKHKTAIKDPALREFLTPKYSVGCRRPTPADNFIVALHESNVHVIPRAAELVNEHGIVDNEDVRPYDVIVCATGFDVSYVPRFPIRGRGGCNLQDDFKKRLECYMGLCVAGYPNYFTFSGPGSPVANGSVFPGTQFASAYMVRLIKKIQSQNIKSMEVTQEAQDDYNEWFQARTEDLVWKDGCRTWYADENGKIRVPFPGSLLHFRSMVSEPLFEDYKIGFHRKNRFAWLGSGRVKEEFNKNVDYTPYIFSIPDSSLQPKSA